MIDESYVRDLEEARGEYVRRWRATRHELSLAEQQLSQQAEVIEAAKAFVADETTATFDRLVAAVDLLSHGMTATELEKLKQFVEGVNLR